MRTFFNEAKQHELAHTIFATTMKLLVLFTLPLFRVIRAGDYGVDCSFPIFSKELNCDNLDRKEFYDNFMEGCRKHYGKRANRCDTTETDRIEMSVRQPRSMVNYTETGFKKIKAPKNVFDLLTKHWNDNYAGLFEREEVWPVGNIYVSLYGVSDQERWMISY